MFDPERGYPGVVPVIRYADAAAGARWLEQVLGARTTLHFKEPDGAISHAELAVAGGVIQIGRQAGAPSSMTLVFVEDVDAAVDHAVDAGGTVQRPAREQPWGLRQATVADPEGHLWELSAHLRDVPAAEWGAEEV